MNSVRVAARIRVVGIVQGVGFRPFVHRLAVKLGLKGYVRNMGGSEVEIWVEGSPRLVSEFTLKIVDEKPPPAKVEELSVAFLKANGYEDFRILRSGTEAKRLSMVPPDIAVCDECLREVYDPSDRHYRYPFNSCAWCGPRFSMMYQVPYDREKTSMRDFPLCDSCLEEYEDPGNLRRFHAQGISCPECGPSIWIEDKKGRRLPSEDPLKDVANLIESGHIVAVKGVGGYHIACLATDEGVIEELRMRKRRPQKPFALMALDLNVVDRYARLDELSAELLSGPERPIVLLPSKGNLPEAIAPGLDVLGFMLPYTPLHHMLLNEVRDRVLIMTSGNVSGKPMCTSEECARRKLAGVVDYFLHHNREIVNRVDDSVIRLTDGRPTFLRRSRGYAPSWVRIPFELERGVVAFGAELQNAGAIGIGDRVVPTQYVGDMDELENLEFLDEALKFLYRMYGLSDPLLVVDMHPGYSTRRLAETWEGDLVEVQHHHAHIASVMAEHWVNVDEGVVGIAVDGLGYGKDGNLWGGEVMLTTYSEFDRVGRLEYFPMPGGDLATKYPVRMLIGVLSKFMSHDEILEFLETKGLVKGLRRGVVEAEIALKQLGSSPRISSVGRFLDSVAALLKVCFVRTYEGEPAIKLESLANKGERLKLEVDVKGGVVQAHQIVEFILNQEGARIEDLAYTAIYALGEVLGRVASEFSDYSSVVAVSGGASVNSILIRGIKEAVGRLSLLTNSRVPPGDGGISLGQIVCAGVKHVQG